MTDFWQGKRVFITGHTGFKGSWLSIYLHSLGANVIGYALPPTSQPNLFELACIEKHVESYFGDVRDAAALQAVINKTKPDIIFHLAAQPLVRYSYEKPLETYQTNVIGTVNLLEAMRTCTSANVLVNITTDKCYENKEWCWGYREIDALGGYDPYSSSKACAEIVTAAYRQSYFNSEQPAHCHKGIASVRAGNVIGGGDWSQDRLVPDMIRAFVAGKKPLLRYPNAIRPWQHVLEPLAGYLLLAEKLWHSPAEFAEAWNLGPHETHAAAVIDVVKSFDNLMGKTGYEIAANATYHEAGCLKLDSAKAIKRLGWSPRWSLATTIHHTAAWYLAWLAGQNMLQFTSQQIQSYITASETINA